MGEHGTKLGNSQIIKACFSHFISFMLLIIAAINSFVCFLHKVTYSGVARNFERGGGGIISTFFRLIFFRRNKFEAD